MSEYKQIMREAGWIESADDTWVMPQMVCVRVDTVSLKIAKALMDSAELHHWGGDQSGVVDWGSRGTSAYDSNRDSIAEIVSKCLLGKA